MSFRLSLTMFFNFAGFSDDFHGKRERDSNWLLMEKVNYKQVIITRNKPLNFIIPLQCFAYVACKQIPPNLMSSLDPKAIKKSPQV